VAVLTTPDRLAESMDLVCHTESMSIASRIAEVARADNDVVIVDTAGRLGPATGALIRNADVVLVVVDDSVLGVTAVDLFLSFVKSVVGPPLVHDAKAGLWPGSGKTLYSLGGKQIKQNFERIAKELGLLGMADGEELSAEADAQAAEGGVPRWFQKIFARKQGGEVR